MKQDSESKTQVYLQLDPGESSITKTFEKETHSATYPYLAAVDEPRKLKGDWTIEFLEGGPVIPDEVITDKLQSWTQFDGAGYRNFSGTARYTTEFEVSDRKGAGWQLDFGKSFITSISLHDWEKIEMMRACLMPLDGSRKILGCWGRFG